MAQVHDLGSRPRHHSQSLLYLVIYLAYFLRQIFVKFILKANSRIAPQDDENQNPYLYTFITGWPLILVFIQTEGVYKSSMGNFHVFYRIQFESFNSIFWIQIID